MNDEKTHLTFQEASDWLKARGVDVTWQTVRRWARIGKVKVLNLGARHKWVAIVHLQQMLKKNTR